MTKVDIYPSQRHAFEFMEVAYNLAQARRQALSGKMLGV